MVDNRPTAEQKRRIPELQPPNFTSSDSKEWMTIIMHGTVTTENKKTNILEEIALIVYLVCTTD